MGSRTSLARLCGHGWDRRVASPLLSQPLLPQRSNVLVVGIDALQLTQSDLQSLMLRIQQRAERDGAFCQRNGFRERADFFRHYQRLSEVLVRDSQMQADQPVIGWVNPQAKHSLPSKVRTALYRSHRVISRA